MNESDNTDESLRKIPRAPITHMYDYLTVCPNCGVCVQQGMWSRPDVQYSSCKRCKSENDLVVYTRLVPYKEP